MTRTRLPAVALYVLAPLLFGALTLWPFLTHAGIPSYQHDWSWSPERVRFHDGLLQMLSTWNEEGFGHPNPFATANPVALVTVALGLLGSPKIGLIVLLSAVSICAGSGVMALAGEITENRAAALGAAFLYLLSPVVFNKTSAGQLAYLEAYAIFPWTVLAISRSLSHGGWRWYSLVALGAGLECVQPQFFLYGPLAAVLLSIVRRSGNGIAVVCAALGGALLLNVPEVLAATTLQRGYALTVPHPVQRFEIMHSVTLSDALRMIGYIIPYEKGAYARSGWAASALLLLFVVPVASFFGFVLRRRDALTRGALLLTLAGIVLCMGERGPLAPLLRWSFVHVSATTVFREFYHSAVLISLGLALGTAAAMSALPRPALAIPVLYAAALSPLMYSGHSADLNFLVQPSGQRAVDARIRMLPPGRVLALPFKIPLRVGDANVSGIDLFGYVDREHMMASEYGDTPELDAVATLAASGRSAEALSILERYGVRYIVWRDWLQSAYPDSLLQPGERRYRPWARKVFGVIPPSLLAHLSAKHCDGGTCFGTVPDARPLVTAEDRTIALPASWTRLANTKAIAIAGAGSAKVQLPVWHLSPSRGWVGADGWRWAEPAWSTLISPLAVIGKATNERLKLASPRADEMPYVGGPLTVCAQRCRHIPSVPSPRMQAVQGDFNIRAEGKAALGSPVTPVEPGAPLHRASLSFTYSLPWRVTGTLRGEGPVLLVFRTRLDRGWVLKGFPVLRRVSADGGLNGWVVDAGKNGGRFAIVYSPERAFLLTAALEMVFYGVLLASGVVGFRLRRSLS